MHTSALLTKVGIPIGELKNALSIMISLPSNQLIMVNLVFFGKPGAGKGTQAEIIKEKFNLVHLSTGDLFRYNMNNNTPLGKLAKSYMDAGNLVPDQVTIDMLEDAVLNNKDAKGFIFDGFPRTTAQAEALDALMRRLEMRIDATIALEADDNILVDRLLNRGLTSGRTDDQDEEKIRNRFAEYTTKTAPLQSFYSNQGKFHEIQGVGEVAEITNRILAVIESL